MKNLLYEEKTPEMSKVCYFYFSPLLFISVLIIINKEMFRCPLICCTIWNTCRVVH